MIRKLGTEIWRMKTPILLLILWVWYWGMADSLKTISFLTGFIALAMILGQLVSKELFGKYKWDVGEKLNKAWESPLYLSDAILAVGMLWARVAIYAAILISMAMIVLLLRGNAFGASTVEDRAKPLIPILMEEHQRIWPESDIGIIAAQIEQESAWKEKARRLEKSGVTSYGLMQVLDVTLKEMQQKHTLLMGVDTARMLQARWGIRAGILYDLQMWKLCSFTGLVKERWAFALASYNGGFGWIQRDRNLTVKKGFDRDVWFGNVELFSRRSPQFFRINREYVLRILKSSEKWRAILT